MLDELCFQQEGLGAILGQFSRATKGESWKAIQFQMNWSITGENSNSLFKNKCRFGFCVFPLAGVADLGQVYRF